MVTSTEITMNTIKEHLLEEGYSLEKSRDEKYIVRINNKGKLLYIGSKYNVQRDIENLINKLGKINLETDIVIFGLAAGEHILSLLDVLGINNKIFVLEPDKNVIKLFLQTDISEKIINNIRVNILYIDEDNIDDVLIKNLNPSKIANMNILTYGNYEKIYEKQYDVFIKAYEDYKINAKLNLNTLNEFSEKLFINYIKNFKYIFNSTKINNIKDIYKGKSAIVVSAGPSLEKNIEQLIDVQDKFIIITGTRTLGSLLSLNVKPDFVVMMDPLDINTKFVKKLSDFSVPLVYEGVSNFKALDLYKGPKIYSKHEELETYVDNLFKEKVDSLYQGGSVAHTCTDLAAYLGCDKIVFIGQDLAYTNNKYHSDKASYSSDGTAIKSEEVTKDKEGLFYIKDIYGKEILTDTILNYYRLRMEQYIKSKKDVKFINSTEGGANIKGTEVMYLKEAVELLGKEKINKKTNEFIKDINNNIDYKEELDKIKCCFKEVLNLCYKGKEYIDKSLNYNYITQRKKIVSTIKKLYDINNIIMGEKKLEFINVLTITIFNEVINNPKYIPIEGEDISHTVSKLRESSKLLYEELSKCLLFVIEEIDKVQSGGEN